VAGFAISLGFIVSGSLVMEIVFSYPGMGFTLLNAVGNNDYPLMQAVFLVITMAVLAANFLVDMLYGFVDPRTRQAR
jgi:peptide/nickel transport system permease protein